MPQPAPRNSSLFLLTETQNKRASAFLRPLSPSSEGTHHFQRDPELLNRLQEWLRNIWLAGNKVSLRINRDFVYQLPNLRPDCTGYVVHLTDTETLAKIVSEGKKKTLRASKLLNKVSSEDIFYGSLFWLRQIKHKPRESPTRSVQMQWAQTRS